MPDWEQIIEALECQVSVEKIFFGQMYDVHMVFY